MDETPQSETPTTSAGPDHPRGSWWPEPIATPAPQASAGDGPLPPLWMGQCRSVLRGGTFFGRAPERCVLTDGHDGRHVSMVTGGSRWWWLGDGAAPSTVGTDAGTSVIHQSGSILGSTGAVWSCTGCRAYCSRRRGRLSWGRPFEPQVAHEHVALLESLDPTMNPKHPDRLDVATWVNLKGSLTDHGAEMLRRNAWLDHDHRCFCDYCTWVRREQIGNQTPRCGARSSLLGATCQLEVAHDAPKHWSFDARTGWVDWVTETGPEPAGGDPLADDLERHARCGNHNATYDVDCTQLAGHVGLHAADKPGVGGYAWDDSRLPSPEEVERTATLASSTDTPEQPTCGLHVDLNEVKGMTADEARELSVVTCGRVHGHEGSHAGPTADGLTIHWEWVPNDDVIDHGSIADDLAPEPDTIDGGQVEPDLEPTAWPSHVDPGAKEFAIPLATADFEKIGARVRAEIDKAMAGIKPLLERINSKSEMTIPQMTVRKGGIKYTGGWVAPLPEPPASRLRGPHPDKLIVDEPFKDITSSGGWCAPSEAAYDLAKPTKEKHMHQLNLPGLSDVEYGRPVTDFDMAIVSHIRQHLDQMTSNETANYTATLNRSEANGRIIRIVTVRALFGTRRISYLFELGYPTEVQIEASVITAVGHINAQLNLHAIAGTL